MKCRSCAAEIDAKAIVCYRCGAPTATPAVFPGAPRRSRPWVAWAFFLVLAVLMAAVYFVSFR